MIIHNNKSKIIIENKNWNKNVIQEGVKKFIYNVEKCYAVNPFFYCFNLEK